MANLKDTNNDPLSFGRLKASIEDLISGDRQRQRSTVDALVAQDVVFSHVLGVFYGREAFYHAYRVAGTVWRYKIGWREYFRSSDGNTVVLVLDLGIRVPPTYLVRYHFPTVVRLRFAMRSGDDGDQGGKRQRLMLVEQSDHHSALALVYLFGWPFSAAGDAARVVSGFILARVGAAIDAVCDARDALLGAVFARAVVV